MTEPQPSPDNRSEMLELRKNAYPLVVLFVVVRRVIDNLGLNQELPADQLDTVVFNTMVKKLEEGV